MKRRSFPRQGYSPIFTVAVFVETRDRYESSKRIFCRANAGLVKRPDLHDSAF